jgi:hypothetical protein
MKPTIDLDWWRDAEGYVLKKFSLEELLSRSGAKDDHDRDMAVSVANKLWIHGMSGKSVPFRPFDGSPELFKEYAAIQRPEQALAFVASNGLLTDPGPDFRMASAHSIVEDAQLMHDMRVLRSEWIAKGGRLARPGDEFSFADMEAVLKPVGPLGMPTLIFRPKTLRDGLWLQAAYDFADEHPPRACQQCGKVFEGRRADAAFCSEEHRRAWYSLERTRKKHREQGTTPRRSPRSAKAS